MLSSHENDRATAVAPNTGSWIVVVAFVGVVLGGAELFLRSNLLWRVPLEYLLQHETDRYTRAAWLVHHPPASGGAEVIVVGSSTAAAVTELPHNESEQILRAALGRPRLQLVSLTDSGGCYPEHLTLLESALERGHHPTAVILFSFPTCLAPYDDTDALLARRMPLVSSSLADLAHDRSLDVRVQARLVRMSAVQRHRYSVNAWIRERWKALLLGRAPWERIVFAGDRRVSAWEGSWELDDRRYERLAKWTPTGPAANQLASFLDLARRNDIPVLVIESPWPPPFFTVLGDGADVYFQAMETIAARGGATYVDPNRSSRLSHAMFNDLVHVNHAGARAYMPIVASELRQLTESR